MRELRAVPSPEKVLTGRSWSQGPVEQLGAAGGGGRLALDVVGAHRLLERHERLLGGAVGQGEQLAVAVGELADVGRERHERVAVRHEQVVPRRGRPLGGRGERGGGGGAAGGGPGGGPRPGAPPRGAGRWVAP